eukprot:6186923-Pleurochrysis_carterae.AAC.1
MHEQGHIDVRHTVQVMGSNSRGAPGAHEERLVQILLEELVGSAVLCRRYELVAPLCSRLVEIAPSRAVRTEHVFTRARAARQASVAGARRRDGRENLTHEGQWHV